MMLVTRVQQDIHVRSKIKMFETSWGWASPSSATSFWSWRRSCNKFLELQQVSWTEESQQEEAVKEAAATNAAEAKNPRGEVRGAHAPSTVSGREYYTELIVKNAPLQNGGGERSRD